MYEAKTAQNSILWTFWPITFWLLMFSISHGSQLQIISNLFEMIIISGLS